MKSLSHSSIGSYYSQSERHEKERSWMKSYSYLYRLLRHITSIIKLERWQFIVIIYRHLDLYTIIEVRSRKRKVSIYIILLLDRYVRKWAKVKTKKNWFFSFQRNFFRDPLFPPKMNSSSRRCIIHTILSRTLFFLFFLSFAYYISVPKKSCLISSREDI